MSKMRYQALIMPLFGYNPIQAALMRQSIHKDFLS
jgi:hypothetical protein